jgi:FtsP/CotA-like multicopper oxidase with cupredoxin domain
MKFAAATALAVALAAVSAAQSPSPSTPRTADGKVDLNGIWGVAPLPPAVKPGQSVRWLLPLKGVDPEGADVFKGLDRVQVNARAAAANKPEYKPELLAKVKELSDKQGVLDPAFYCKPQGVPRMGAPAQIVQTPGQVVFLYAASNLFRVIPTDGRPHRADADPSYMGDSIGRFEGDTLVVDVTNFNDDTWLGSDGYFHSEKMHVVERLTRNGDVLTYTVTVEDPLVLAKPWTRGPANMKLSTNPADALLEAPPCVEHDAPHIVTLDHH